MPPGVFASGFFLTYLVWPKLCHRFVGYVEEEAVHSYTMLLEQLDAGGLPEFSSMPCPDVGKRFCTVLLLATKGCVISFTLVGVKVAKGNGLG